MKCTNNIINIFLFGLIIFLNNISMSLSWEFAVTTRSQIILYDKNWDKITTEADEFDDLSAIEFNGIENEFFFNDREHQNGTIFSFKLLNETHTSQIQQVVQKTTNELVHGIAYDQLDKVLYWTDSTNERIYKLDLSDPKKKKEAEIFIQFENKTPVGIAIDVCRRNLYWTNSYISTRTASIEMISLKNDLSKPISKVIVSNVRQPLGITVDQYSERIYWVDDMQRAKVIIESAKLDGSDRQLVFQKYGNEPANLIVDENLIYWSDSTHNAVWKYDMKSESKVSEMIDEYDFPPRGIIIKSNSIVNSAVYSKECEKVMIKIIAKNDDLQLSTTTQSSKYNIADFTPLEINSSKKKFKSERVNKLQQIQTQIENETETETANNACDCKKNDENREGICKVNKCDQFCLNGGECFLSKGLTECRCPDGYSGKRCENYVCSQYCLNGASCQIDRGQPVCNCPEFATGRRCSQININQLYRLHCNNSKRTAIKLDEIENFEEFCKNYDENNSSNGIQTLQINQRLCNLEPSCAVMKNSVLIITAGVVSSLTILLLILFILRKLYKPLRPKVKKTYVVRKNLTALTSRPSATEQCEITIENCCNMNICDTPCFDPKILNGGNNATRISHSNGLGSNKDDKRKLLSDMDCHGDLY